MGCSINYYSELVHLSETVLILFSVHLERIMKTYLLCLVFTTFLCTSVLAIGYGTPECPSGWAKRLTRCYMFSNTTATWFAAYETCAKQHATLVSIESKVELDNINGWINTYGKYATQWWVSGSDLHSTGNWVWYGTKTPIYYQNYCSSADLGNGHCLAISKSCKHAWVSGICQTDKFHFVCEKGPVWVK